MAKQKTINVEGADIRIFENEGNEFFSLTDIAKKFNDRPEILIQNWMRNRNTVEFLGVWEKLNNENFNHIEFDVIRNQTGLNSFALSVSKWSSQTKAIGLMAKSGRYGGTYAHKDLALAFCYWVSPPFQLYIIKEFQRLKEKEVETLEWNVKRTLAKVNYRIHTDAIKENLIPQEVNKRNASSFIYASEADVLNVALFGMTARDWRDKNPNSKGNIRDQATTEQLLVLANMENLNSEFIKSGFKQIERLERLNQTAIQQMKILLDNPSSTKKLK